MVDTSSRAARWSIGGTADRALMRLSRSAITSFGAELPVSGLYLIPLNWYGLWLAVTTAAPVALRSITVHEATWVGEGRSKITVRTPLVANISATVRAKSSEAKRQS